MGTRKHFFGGGDYELWQARNLGAAGASGCLPRQDGYGYGYGSRERPPHTGNRAQGTTEPRRQSVSGAGCAAGRAPDFDAHVQAATTSGTNAEQRAVAEFERARARAERALRRERDIQANVIFTQASAERTERGAEPRPPFHLVSPTRPGYTLCGIELNSSSQDLPVVRDYKVVQGGGIQYRPNAITYGLRLCPECGGSALTSEEGGGRRFGERGPAARGQPPASPP